MHSPPQPAPAPTTSKQEKDGCSLPCPTLELTQEDTLPEYVHAKQEPGCFAVLVHKAAYVPLVLSLTPPRVGRRWMARTVVRRDRQREGGCRYCKIPLLLYSVHGEWLPRIALPRRTQPEPAQTLKVAPPLPIFGPNHHARYCSSLPSLQRNPSFLSLSLLPLDLDVDVDIEGKPQVRATMRSSMLLLLLVLLALCFTLVHTLPLNPDSALVHAPSNSNSNSNSNSARLTHPNSPSPLHSLPLGQPTSDLQPLTLPPSTTDEPDPTLHSRSQPTSLDLLDPQQNEQLTTQRGFLESDRRYARQPRLFESPKDRKSRLRRERQLLAYLA